VKFIAFGFELGPGMTGEGRANDPSPRRPRSAGDENRKNTFTGDQTQRSH
jgi:hypothetical protein